MVICERPSSFDEALKADGSSTTPGSPLLFSEVTSLVFDSGETVEGRFGTLDGSPGCIVT